VRRRAGTLLLVTTVCAAAAACSGAQVGFGVPRQPSPSAFAGARQDVAGVVAIRANGCVDLDLDDLGLRWIVWPDATTTANDGADIVVRDHVVASGDTMTGTGTLADASVLPGWQDAQGSYFGSFGRFCKADELGVVILDDATVTTG
jgi:hypothetical protein